MNKRVPNVLTENRDGIKVATFVAECPGDAIVEKAPLLAEMWTPELPHFVSVTRIAKELHHIFEGLSGERAGELGMLWKMKRLSNCFRRYQILLTLIGTG